MQGLQIGGGWAEKWEARRLQEARQTLLDQQNARKEARENRRLDLYEKSVGASVDLARARAQRLMQPKGGGGGAPAGSASGDALLSEASQRGILVKEAPPQPAANVTNVYQSDDGSSDSTPAPPPDEMRRGGMVREKLPVRRLAKGGRAGSAFMSSFQSAMSKYSKDKDKDKTGTPIVPPSTTPAPATGPPTAITPVAPTQISTPTVSPDLTGTGESYSRGGRARRFAEGGAVSSDEDFKAFQKKIEDLKPKSDEEDLAKKTGIKDLTDDDSSRQGSTGTFSSGSANGATGSGGDAAGGVSGTGGIGGSATGGQGGSAAAGVGGDSGGTYRRGGRVRRFQGGGRVLEDSAIDTGTSGPGSGYGFRAAPPANAGRRRY